MKTFQEWLATGPLAGQELTQRDRTLLHIAYLEGAASQIDENRARLAKILQGRTDQSTASAS